MELIEQKYREVTENWLRQNGVPFDELVFGKPIADLYVDDKAMSVKDFRSAEFGLLHGGGSRRAVYRIGSIVKKDLGSADEVMRFKQWIEDNHASCKFPAVTSYLYSSVYMDYIDGARLVDDCTSGDLHSLLQVITRFSEMPVERFTIEPQIEILRKNKSDDPAWNELIDKVEHFLRDHEAEIAARASYSHGDMILSNVLKGKDGLYLIDPRYFRESSTYLYDLAKLRMSLMDYERRFGLSEKTNVRHLALLDSYTSEIGVRELVIGLMLMYICRLYRYKDGEQKAAVRDFALEVMEENADIFTR
jgi:hypothetical protein